MLVINTVFLIDTSLNDSMLMMHIAMTAERGISIERPNNNPLMLSP